MKLRAGAADEVWDTVGADQEELRDGALDGDGVKLRAGIAGRLVTADGRRSVSWLETVLCMGARAGGRVLVLMSGTALVWSLWLASDAGKRSDAAGLPTTGELCSTPTGGRWLGTAASRKCDVGAPRPVTVSIR